MTNATFTCDLCGQTCEKEWSDEEATTEARQLFGANFDSQNGDESAIICDDCWQQLARRYGWKVQHGQEAH